MNRTDLLAARVPRYTSYPTAPHFNAGVDGPGFRAWLEALTPSEPLSLYFHIPFCRSLCWFCGCHTRAVNGTAAVEAYTDTLLRELDLVADALGSRRRVTHIHFGGGSPTILSPGDVARLDGAVRSRFHVAREVEIAVEVDPRGLREDTVEAFARAGVTRASVGVQDANPEVQRAINRRQPEAVTRAAVARLRGAGIDALNVDLMYGLPHQSADDLRRTIDAAVALDPQRLAVFGYAHVPEMKPHQRLIDATVLSGAAARLEQFELAHRHLAAYGFQPIGFDHFARQDDILAQAQRSGRLHRNFQGYTADDAKVLVGFGASAISSLPRGYAQNASATPDYHRKVRAGAFATARGRETTGEDCVRRAIIERLMCDLSVDIEAIAARHDWEPAAFIPDLRALAALQEEGYVRIDGWRVTIPSEMRAGVRVTCAAFDRYLAPNTARHAVAV